MKKKLLIVSSVVIIAVVVLFVSGAFERMLYKIDPFLYGMFYRDGMVYQPKISDKLLHYKSEKYGIEIDYPEGYLLNDKIPSEGVIVTIESSVYLKDPSNQNIEGLAIVTMDIPKEYSDFTAKDILEEKKMEYLRQPESVSNIGDVKEMTIQNEKAAYLVYDVDHSKDNKIMRTTKEVAIIHDGKLYLLTFNDAKNEYPQSVINADRMIGSFIFSK